MYEVLEDVDKVIGSMVSGAVKDTASSSTSQLLKLDQLSTEQQTAVVLFVGSQIDEASLRKAGPSSKLRNAVGSSKSSLVVPHALFMGKSLKESLAGSLRAGSVNFKSIGCGSDASEDLGADAAKALDGASKLQVLLVCSSVSHELDHSPAGLDAELEQLATVQEAVEAAGFNHVTVYTSHPCEHGDVHGRSLLQAKPPAPRRRMPPPPPKRAMGYYGFGPYTSCGQLCQTQVRWLEGILAAIFMALASCAGLTCLNVLNTPTRFEVLKEGGAAM